MEYATLKNGVAMPMAGFGTYLISDETECQKSVEWALETGYRLFDTAQIYGNEAAVGNAIQAAGIPRKELFLETKIWVTSYTEEKAQQALENSLRFLQTDYLDLVLLHWPFGDTYAAWRVLEKAYQEGVIRAIGVSNYTNDRIVDLCHFAEIPPAVNQVEANLWCQRQEEMPWHEKYGVQLQAYAPMGRKRPGELFLEPRLTAIADAHGKTVRQIMLRYLMQRGIVVIPKSVHQERIQENFQLFDFMLSDQEMSTLLALDLRLPIIGAPQDPTRVEHLLK